MQFEMGISTMRYLPASGTAGLERSLVSGKRRVPAPPPMMIASVLSAIDGQLKGLIQKKHTRFGRASPAFGAEGFQRTKLATTSVWSGLRIGAEDFDETTALREF